MTHDTSPTSPFNAECARFEERLMAYLEHDLDADGRSGMERHRSACRRCDGMLRELEALSAAAAVLPTMAPTRDLWSGISARLDTPVVPLFGSSVDATPSGGRVIDPSGPASHTLTSRTPRRVISVRTFAIAATALIAVSSAVTWRLALTRAVDRGSIASGPIVSDRAAATAVLPVANAGATYEREIAALRTIVNDRFTELDSGTVEVLRRNLEIIDKAILDSRNALEQDPSSRILSSSLDRALESKLDLMRRVALL